MIASVHLSIDRWVRLTVGSGGPNTLKIASIIDAISLLMCLRMEASRASSTKILGCDWTISSSFSIDNPPDYGAFCRLAEFAGLWMVIEESRPV